MLIENNYGDKFSDNYKAIIEEAIIFTLEYKSYHSNVEISILIVDNNEIKKLNNEYRNIDKETDVLSFPLINPSDIPNFFVDSTSKIYLGDIVLSFDKVISQAIEFGHSTERELAFLVVHSMLHLLGHDHQNQEDEKEMFFMQEEILKKAGYLR